jgi:hypothetical protein
VGARQELVAEVLVAVDVFIWQLRIRTPMQGLLKGDDGHALPTNHLDYCHSAWCSKVVPVNFRLD